MTQLLVAATGGHLTELARLRRRLVDDEPVTWVTFPGSQSEQLLEGEDVVHARPMVPRDYRGLARNTTIARRLLRERPIDRVISTGSGVALSFLPLARARGIETHYIECAARTAAPSVTGRVLAAVPGVRLYAQYRDWANGRWSYGGSVFDPYVAEEVPGAGRPHRIVVLVGTMPFPFTRLVERLRRIIPAGAEVLWQIGSTPGDGLRAARASLAPEELREAVSQADVVVAHGGIGSTLDALDAGRLPVLVPRRRRFGEHVDDHQAGMARALDRRGIAIAREAGELTWADIERAAAMRVRTLAEPPRFVLR
jgi:UDP-N-acetylglucosamine--N-acetylmuramyl-(pentapeptide) pyrophosphoryl-undecaprenol N-acetylglucosamine transferase